ncbi:MAG: single-stranded DNA-binding protein [Candidatus Dormibacteria bacterium]
MHASNGTAVASFRIVNHGTDELQFHNIIAWRCLAEIAAEHSSKGRLVYVGGRLHSRSWTGQDGLSR